MLLQGITHSNFWRGVVHGLVAVALVYTSFALVTGVENVSTHFTDMLLFILPAGLIGFSTVRLGMSKGAFLFASLNYWVWGWMGMLIFAGFTNRLDRPVYSGPPLTPQESLEIQLAGILIGLSVALGICWVVRRRMNSR